MPDIHIGEILLEENNPINKEDILDKKSSDDSCEDKSDKVEEMENLKEKKASADVASGDNHIYYVTIDTDNKDEQDKILSIFANDVNLAKTVEGSNPGLEGHTVILALFGEDEDKAKGYVSKILSANDLDNKVVKHNKEVKEENKMEKQEKTKSILEKLSAIDFLSLSEYFKKQAGEEPIKEAAKPIVPEMPKKEEPKKEEVKKEDKPLDGKKDEVKEDKKTSFSEVISELNKLKDIEKGEGESEDVALIEKIISKVQTLEKDLGDKKEIKPEPKKEEPKKEEVKKEDKPLDGKKDEPFNKAPKKNPMGFKPQPFMPKKENLRTVFVKKEPIEASQWEVYNKIATIELGCVFNKEADLNPACDQSFGEVLKECFSTKGMTKEAVLNTTASYSPCYPTHKKMQAPVVSKHPKSKDEVVIEKDTQVAPIKQASKDNIVEKKAEVESELDKIYNESEKEEPKEEVKTESSVKQDISKKAEKAETDSVISDTEGSKVKESEHNNPNNSGHAKSKDKASSETDIKLASMNDMLNKMSEENTILTKKLAEMKMQVIADKKMESCQRLVEAMVDKNLLKVNEEYRQAAIREGSNLEVANKTAFKKSVDDQIKQFLQMDDLSLKAFASSLDNIERKAEKTASVLKKPIKIQASEAVSEVEEISALAENLFD